MNKLINTALVIILLALLSVLLHDRYEDRRLQGPRSSSSVLIKPGTQELYETAEQPCPAYPHPTIVAGNKVGELLADCDGDHFVDERTLPPAPLMSADQPNGGPDPKGYVKQWAFVLRPGVEEIRLKDPKEEQFIASYIPSESYLEAELQKEFESAVKKRR